MLVSRSAHPILDHSRPWESECELRAVSVLPEPAGQMLRLYYLAIHRSDALRNVLCVARSPDGVVWDKPDLGDGTNIVMRSSGVLPDWGVFMPTGVLCDERETAPACRWKMVYWDRLPDDPRPGIVLAVSPDGLRWTRLGDRPIITNANDAMSFIQTQPDLPTPLHRAAFLLYQQTWHYNPALPQERDNLKGMHRHISVWSTERFDGRWIGPVTVLTPDVEDPPDVQFYWLTPFHRRRGYGGFLMCHHTSDQTMDVQLVTSDDGWTWRRALGRRPLLSLGAPGAFDSGMVIATAAPVYWQGRVLLLYNGNARVHDGQLRDPIAPTPDPEDGIGLAVFTDALLE